MTTRRQWYFVRAQLAWMMGAILILSLIGELSLQLFFSISFIGFLVLIEFTAPVNVTPSWRARLKWFILLGLLTFTYVASKRVLEAIPAGWL